ncbi:hypothetical protein ACE3MZ_09815 [Paenibacillus sp. WLX1005]|uniref:hypothetical protein n=1 Tax=unclassified Paenibacillus TaxID=185978 RepID=UPI0039843543
MPKTWSRCFIPFLVMILAFTSVFSSYAHAEVQKDEVSQQALDRAKQVASMTEQERQQELGSIPDLEQKQTALSESLVYQQDTGTIVINQVKAKQLYSFSEQELKGYTTFLNSLTPEETNDLLQAYGVDVSTTNATDGNVVTPQIAPIIWIGIIAIGVIAGGVIFSALYFNHQQKMTLINRCYDEGGTPKIDSRDQSGLNGTTNSGAAEGANGYKFECIK